MMLSGLRNALKVFKPNGSVCAGGKAIMLPTSFHLGIFGCGHFSVPLSQEDFKKVKSFASQSPFGKGKDTIIDLKVRNSLQIDGSKIEIKCEKWQTGLQALVREASQQLGVDSAFVRSDLYKLLIYENDGLFLSHRDTEKAEGMFATLVVQLPSIFTGGNLKVRHHNISSVFAMGTDDNSTNDCVHYTVFYADCGHAVQRICSGTRLVLVYSLCWSDEGPPPTVTFPTEQIANVAQRVSQIESCFGVLLKHEYTQSSLQKYGVRCLKREDRLTADVLNCTNLMIRQENPDDELVFRLVRAERVIIDDENGGPERHDPALSLRRDSIFCLDGTNPPSDCTSHTVLKEFELYRDVVNAFSKENPGETRYRINDVWWKDSEGYGVRITGNEGVGEITTYHCYVLVMWQKKKEFELLCQADLPQALNKVIQEGNPEGLIGKVADFISTKCELDDECFVPALERLVEIGSADLVTKFVHLMAEKPLYPIEKRLNRIRSAIRPRFINDWPTLRAWYRAYYPELEPGLFGIPSAAVANALAQAVLSLGWAAIGDAVVEVLKASQQKKGGEQLPHRLQFLVAVFPHIRGLSGVWQSHRDDFVSAALAQKHRRDAKMRETCVWGLALLLVSKDTQKLNQFVVDYGADRAARYMADAALALQKFPAS